MQIVYFIASMIPKSMEQAAWLLLTVGIISLAYVNTFMGSKDGTLVSQDENEARMTAKNNSALLILSGVSLGFTAVLMGESMPIFSSVFFLVLFTLFAIKAVFQIYIDLFFRGRGR